MQQNPLFVEHLLAQIHGTQEITTVHGLIIIQLNKKIN